MSRARLSFAQLVQQNFGNIFSFTIKCFVLGRPQRNEMFSWAKTILKKKRDEDETAKQIPRNSSFFNNFI